MSMFDWQASSTPNTTNGVVVSNIWIYWAVSLPLTLVVLGGWRFWWHHQEGYYMRKYPHVKKIEEV